MDRSGELVDGLGTYQIKKLREALGYVKAFRVAVDVGGHVGFWSMQLAKRFQFVQAFEPMPEFRACFEKNVRAGNVALNWHALGECEREVGMAYDPADSGGTHVDGAGDIAMRTLDSFAFEHVDFVKIDCEGYEHHVIAGAKETIARCRPCVIVEQKPHKLGLNFGIAGTPAVDLLKSWGYSVAREMSGDYIMVPAE